ncbi:hypothetical protein HDV05_008660, partial [Chytridiales sp. JEL 0842]
MQQAQKVITDTVDELIRIRKSDTQGSTKVDLLSVLLQANNEESDPSKRLSNEEVKGQVLTFLAAGHETVSVTLSWTLHLLSTHPEIQSKLRAELFNELHDPSSEPSADALNSGFPYLEIPRQPALPAWYFSERRHVLNKCRGAWLL